MFEYTPDSEKRIARTAILNTVKELYVELQNELQSDAYIPVIILDLPGTQTGFPQYISVKTVPSLASLSKFGVETNGCPI